MSNKSLYIYCVLKDSFMIEGSLHTGFYDGAYRRLIKQSIKNIKIKTDFKSDLDSHIEIVDSYKSTSMKIILRIPSDWTEERFKGICLNEITKNPSVDLILESFTSTSADTKNEFLSEYWNGLEKINR